MEKVLSDKKGLASSVLDPKLVICDGTDVELWKGRFMKGRNLLRNSAGILSLSCVKG